MGNSVTIDDGFKTYDIVNKEGKLLGSFSFCPTDAGLTSRYKEVSKNLINMGDFIGEKTGTDEEKFLEAECYVKEQFNYLFNSNISESFFSIMSPLSVLPSGQFFAEHVMEVVAKIVKDEAGLNFEKIKLRVSKYTKKYHG